VIVARLEHEPQRAGFVAVAETGSCGAGAMAMRWR
jgi:hypothetical protein